jgi:TolB-like protein
MVLVFPFRAAALALLLLPLWAAHAASEDSKRIVAVLYFDNNTGDSGLDVLQKGFADMMVTDLSSVQQLQLVEREKLQAIIDEQKLQRSRYFDPKTAVKLGKLAGAQYAVSGSFQAMEPQLRIDIRMFELRTGNVLVTGQVVGLKNKLFELQQQLVNRFIDGLQLKLSGAPRLRSRAPDLDTLLSYSKGIDLVDQGKLQEASQQLAAVVSKAPTFLLARERHEQILARLKASEQRRTEALGDLNEALGKRAEEYLRTHQQSETDERESAQFLGYRLVRMQYLLRALLPHLAQKHPYVVLPGHEAQALAIMQLWRAQAMAYVRESAGHFRRFHTVLPDGPYLGSNNLTLEPEDEQRLKPAKYRDLRFDEDAAASVAQFILTGRFHDRDESYVMGPTLADLDPTAMAEGNQLLEQALKDASNGLTRLRESRARQVLELHGDALLLRGKVEEAVAKWQQFLDSYPTSIAFDNISRKIKTALGVGPNQRENAYSQYNEALNTCDKNILREGFSHEMNRRMVLQGYKAAREIFLELDAKCGKSEELKFTLRSLLVTAALTAARIGDCDTFHALSPRFLELKGSQSDLNGYLKNYVPHCTPKDQPPQQP